MGLPSWLSGKESTCQCRRCRFDPWIWKLPGGGNDNPWRYCCQGKPMDRGVRWATVHGATKSCWTTHGRENMINTTLLYVVYGSTEKILHILIDDDENIFCLFYLYKTMNVHLTYCSNHFMMYIKSNYSATHTLKLYKAVCQRYLSQTGRGKKQYGKSLWVLIWVLV